MNFDFDYALQILPTLLRATVITFQATVGGMVLAMIVGLALELLAKWTHPDLFRDLDVDATRKQLNDLMAVPLVGTYWTQ